MPIVDTDIVYRLTTTAGAAGDTTAGTPATSLGKYVSTSVITTAQLNNLWDNVTGSESAAGDVEYRAIAVLNNHASLTLTNAQIEIQSQTSGGGLIAIAVDNVAASAKGSASAQGDEIADESEAPSPVGAFGSGPLALGDLGPGQVRLVWLRRTVTAGAGAVDPDGVVLRVFGDTLP